MSRDRAETPPGAMAAGGTGPATDHRYRQMLAWLETLLKPPFRVEPASLDASFRRYFRIHHHDARWIVMDAPPAREDAGRFVRVQGLLASLGITVPAIPAADLQAGFLLLDDFGERLYLQALDAGSADRLYGAALDTLWRLQRADTTSTVTLPPYDEALLCRELAIFEEWFLSRHLGIELDAGERRLFAGLHELLVASALEQPRVRVHRDFHSRNLMVLDRGSPGVLDFQDAVVGPVTYDLVSLLRDCYIAWPAARVRHWCLAYRQRLLGSGLEGPDQTTFLRWFDLLGMQRHLKAVGIFARLHHRDGRSGYLGDIPRTLDYIRQVAGRYAETREFARWLARRLPP